MIRRTPVALCALPSLLAALGACSSGSSPGFSITAATPGVIQGGDTGVAWTLIGSGFEPGATVTTTLPGATIASVNVVSAAQITFALSAPGGTAAGLTEITVTNPDASATSRPVPAVPQVVALSTEVQPVLTANCTSCHSAGLAAAGLDLTAGTTFGATVNIASTQVPALARVVPADPDSSYLVDKIQGTHTVGGIMPPGGALGIVDIVLVRKWIEAGALNN